MIAYFKEEIPFFRNIWMFIGGIASSIYLQQPFSSFIFLWIFLFLFLISFLIISNKLKIYNKQYIASIIISLLFFFSGFIICDSRKEIYNEKHFSKTASEYLLVNIVEAPKIKGDIARFTVEVKAAVSQKKLKPTIGHLLLAMRFDSTKKFDYQYGNQLLIKSKYKETEPPYNPSEFNYKRFLSFKQIYHQSFINSYEIKKISTNKGNWLISFALKFRDLQVNKLKQYLPSKEAQVVAATLILGYRANLEQNIINTYSKTGTMHVLSVSGMHVAILLSLLNLLFYPLEKIRFGKLVKLLLTLFCIWFYGLITGFSPSIIRAAIMLSFLLLAVYLSGRKINTFNILAIAAFIILLFDPFSLVNAGFQLSFTAVLGLLYFQPYIFKILFFKNKLMQILWQLISVSLAAQLSTFIISIYYFHQFPLYFILSNIFITLPAFLIMYLGIAFLTFSFFGFLQTPLGFLLNKIIIMTNKGLALIEHLPSSSISQIWLSYIEILFLLGAFLLLIFRRKNKAFFRSGIAFILLFICLHSYATFEHLVQKKAVFFSLRKNTAIAFIKGQSAVLISDLDSADYTFNFSVKPFLDSCRINNLRLINPHENELEKVYHFENKILKIIPHQGNTFSDAEVNWLLYSGNKIFKPSDLRNNHFDELFIDGKNRDFVIDSLKTNFSRAGISPLILKRVFAVIYDLE